MDNKVVYRIYRNGEKTSFVGDLNMINKIMQTLSTSKYSYWSCTRELV